MTPKYGKRDAERAAFIAWARAQNAAYKPPEILRCRCGEKAVTAVTKIGGVTTLLCVDHESEATI